MKYKEFINNIRNNQFIITNQQFITLEMYEKYINPIYKKSKLTPTEFCKVFNEMYIKIDTTINILITAKVCNELKNIDVFKNVNILNFDEIGEVHKRLIKGMLLELNEVYNCGGSILKNNY